MRVWLSSIVVTGLIGLAHPARAQTITVDGAQRHQVMDGWINQMRVWDDPHLTNTFRPARPGEDAGRSAVDIPLSAQNDILSKLYGDLGITHVQTVMEPGAQPVQGGPFNFNWKRNDAHVDYVKQAKPLGLKKTIFWNYNGESWAANVADPSLQANWEMALLRRWRALGVEPEYAMVWNEPTFNGPWVTADYLRELIRLIGRQLAAEGFSTKILAPEGLNLEASMTFLQTLMADAEVRGYIGAITTHLYGNGANLGTLAQIRDQFAKPYGKPIWMSEYSDVTDPFEFAALMSDLISGYDVANISYEWGFFGQWETKAHFITVNYDGNNVYTGYTREKIYYAFGQFSRFVRPAAQRIDATSTEHSLKVTAYRDAGSLSVVVVNNTASTFNGVGLNLASLPTISSLTAFRTSASEEWAALPAVPISGTGFKVDFPPKSVTTFTWADPSQVDAGAPPDGGIAVDGGRLTGGPDGGAGSGNGSTTSTESGSPGGCACRAIVARSPASEGASATALAVLALAVRRRRRSLNVPQAPVRARGRTNR